MAALAAQVRDDPVLLPNLQIFESQVQQFGSSQATADQNGHHRSITQTAGAVCAVTINEALALRSRKPVAHSHAESLDSLHTGDSGRKFGAQQPSLGRFECEPANGSQVEIDSRWRVTELLKIDAVPQHDRAVEC